MRNKGFFWFLTILVAIVCIYQISFTFVTNRVEKSADKFAVEQLDSLKNLVQSQTDKTILLPNGRELQLDNIEAEDIIVNYYTNAYLIEKGEKKVSWTGATYNEAKNRSINLGLDLKGGMSVTLEISIPDLVKNEAVNPRNARFGVPYEKAVTTYRTSGGDFIDIFVTEYRKQNKDRKLIDDFFSPSNSEVLEREASDDKVISYLRGKVTSSLTGVENIMNRRINQFGVAQPNIQKDENSNRIYIELPGVKDKNTVRQKLQSTANLEFFETYHNVEFVSFLEEADKVLNTKYGEKKDIDASLELSLDDNNAASADTTNTADSTSSDDAPLLSLDGDSTKTEADSLKTKEAQTDPATSVLYKNIVQMGTFNQDHSEILFYAQAKDTASISRLLKDNDVRALLPVSNVRFMWSSTPIKFDVQNKSSITAFPIHAIKIPENGRAFIDGNDIDDANQDFDQNGRIGVSLKMTAKGSIKWSTLTNNNFKKTVAICMDNMVISSPMVQAKMNDGRAIITGNYTVDEAKEFAALLNAGSLPAPCVIVDESVVGSTLGEQNISSGMTSFAIALIMVLLYMVFFYSKAGLIANIALLVNILFILGSLASFGAVLTLAGIAGIVLTIGMAVDANVLIFERIKEEVAAGKGQKQAISDGFSKALSSILDANITTLLTAIILKIFGSGPIESFATTLIIGIFSSVFAAVIVSRLIFEYISERKGEISFSTNMTKNFMKNKSIRFMSKRKSFYVISGILVLVSVGMLATRGLKFGIEFTGGRSFEVRFDKATNNEEIAKNLKMVFVDNGKTADVIVKKKESKNIAEIQTNFMHTTVNADTLVDQKLREGLDMCKASMGEYQIVQSRSISAVISDELKTSSTYAILISLIVIFFYILLRFGKWQYGLGALAAMSHDVILVLGAYAALHGIMPFNMDIDQAFIAAILTVVGYSINDTVVIFDRIREVLGLHKSKDTESNINDALNSTLSRTINTSGSTLVVLLVIFLLGGAAIQGFIFALIIGVLVGTYSSICIASPMIVDLTTKKGQV